MTFTESQIAVMCAVAETAGRLSLDVYLVGGIVRDLYLCGDVAERDLDFVVVGDAMRFADTLAAEIGGEVRKFSKFGTAKVICPANFVDIAEIDFAGARQEVYASPGALPTVSPASLEQDLSRRDFTINALAIPLRELPLHAKQKWLKERGKVLSQLSESVIDQFDGLSDLQARLVRVLHSKSFIDDPTRLFRACRYAVRVGGNIEEQTKALFEEALAVGALDTVSDFRKLNEIKRAFGEDRSAPVLKSLYESGVLQCFELFDMTRASEVFAALDALDSYIPVDSAAEGESLRFEVGLRLFFCFNVEERRREFAERFSISRKRQKVFAEDCQRSAEWGSLDELSDLACVLALVWCGASDDTEDETAQRSSLLRQECELRGMALKKCV